MSQTKSFWEHPVAKLEEALSIRKTIASLQNKLSALFGTDDDQVAKPVQQNAKRKISSATRAKMRAAQQARHAKKQGSTATTPVETAAAPAKPTRSKAKQKRGVLTPEGRAKLSAAMKARWDAKKNAGK